MSESAGRNREMRITDLLDRRSISLTGTPKSKSEALDQIIDLMIKSEKIVTGKRTGSRSTRGKRRALPGSARESRFHTENVTRS